MTGRPLALITGGTRRVGLAIGRTLAAAGCDLVITYREKADEAQAAAAELQRYGATVRPFRLDLDDVAAVDKAGERLADEMRRLDVLVHNASIYQQTPLSTMSVEQVMSHLRVNAASPLVLTRRLAPMLTASTLPGGGAVVAMCDMHVLGRPRKDFAAYSMSKAALVEMVRVLARELAPHVRVNGVAPGVVAFPESGYESTPQMQEAYLKRVPMERSGTPEDAAEAVRWLALDARYTTGEVVRVDGGRWLA